MERLTDKRMKGDGFVIVDPAEYKAFVKNEKPNGKQIYKRLLEIEDILGDDYDLDRLRELVEADKDGRCVALWKMLPLSPHPDGDEHIEACQGCGSGEYLYNEDGNRNKFCGQCGQAIKWTDEK